MANWAKGVPAGNSNRRKWNLEDRASLNNLKFQWAKDGCSDVQYDLASQLLDSNSELNETSSSHAQGVYWLLCAARQGHKEALQMLDECYRNRRGITDSNEREVRSYLSMTPGERAARKAAHELFSCLANGEEHITPAQLERKMREIYKLQKKRRKRRTAARGLEENTEDSASSEDERAEPKENGHLFPSPSRAQGRQDIFQQDLITEAHLVSAAVNYSHGRLPTVNEILTLSIPHPGTLDHVPCFHRLIFHPIVFLTLLYHRFIRAISSFPGAVTSNLKFVILFLVYALFSAEATNVFLPVVAYYISLIIMIWSTFKMLKTKHDFIDFRIWSGLFLSYGDNNVDANGSENQFLRNNLKPYLLFFGAFIVNLVIYPVMGNEWLPHSEVTVISFVLVFTTMIAFMYTAPRRFPDFLILVSFGINVLAKYPYEMDTVVTTGWRFLDLKVPTFCSFVIGNGIEFCLNCRAVLYLMIPGILIHLAHRSNWHGIYKYLIPHCVTLSWLQIFITSSQSATMFGLVRATLGLAGILLFLPLFGIITLMIPIFVTVEWLGLTNPNMRIFISLAAASVAILASCLLAINRTTQKYVTVLQVGVCLIAAAVLILPYMTSNFQASHPDSSIFENLIGRKRLNEIPEEDLSSHPISWESYNKYCGHPSWENFNKIETQIKCSQLEGLKVKWEGFVTNVEIVKVQNFWAMAIKTYLPEWLADILICIYGDKNNIDCKPNENCEEMRNFINDQKKCNLNKWDIYEYEIRIRMHSGILSKSSEINLRAKDYFGNFTRNLNHSDRVWFRGTLSNYKADANGMILEMRLGGGQPLVELTEIGCVSCQNKAITSVELHRKRFITVNARMRDLMRGVKYLLNVLFNPLLTFK